MLSERQKELLNIVIREYIHYAEPVGSEALVFKKRIDVSPATIRNEMKELEELGFLFQPHISAGRVPTENGYRYFVNNLMGEYKIKESEKKNLSIRQAEDLDSDNFENLMKEKARILSNLTSEAVILSFGRESIYYTGLTNLFSKPEFEEVRLVISFSEILDKLDEAVQKLLKKNWKGVKILIGSESPFGKECSVIIGNYKIKKWHGLMGILGPLRIDYEKCVALLKYLLDNLEVK